MARWVEPYTSWTKCLDKCYELPAQLTGNTAFLGFTRFWLMHIANGNSKLIKLLFCVAPQKSNFKWKEEQHQAFE